jgi:hypothetical protein
MGINKNKRRKEMKESKFKIGDVVNCPKTLYGETKGKIREIRRSFHKIDEKENFIRGGLSILESEIENMSCECKLDGEFLIITHESNIEKFKFRNYAYIVKTEKMNTIFSEKSLKKA